MDSVPPYTLVPRFILGLQNLYARDLQGRRGSEIDTAFGFTSGSGHGAITWEIMFVDGGQNDGLEEGEEIQMEEREIRSAGSGAQWSWRFGPCIMGPKGPLESWMLFM